MGRTCSWRVRPLHVNAMLDGPSTGAGYVRIDHSCPAVSGVGEPGSSPVPPIPEDLGSAVEMASRDPSWPGVLAGAR